MKLKNYEHNLKIFKEYENKHGIYFDYCARNYYAEKFANMKLTGISAKDVLPRLKGNCYYKMVAYVEDTNGVQWETSFDIEIDEKITMAVQNSNIIY